MAAADTQLEPLLPVIVPVSFYSPAEKVDFIKKLLQQNMVPHERHIRRQTLCVPGSGRTQIQTKRVQQVSMQPRTPKPGFSH
jgi:hypothetical protein